MNPTAPWRRRLSELGRGLGKAHPPLFAPLLYGVASQIEALPPSEVTADPTRLGKCLVELQRVVGTASLVVAAPTAMEAEALGAEVDRGSWPPRVLGAFSSQDLAVEDFDAAWARSEALGASIEACRRLSKTQAGEPVLMAALTGPASLLQELFKDVIPEAGWDFAGRALAALVRQFAQAGASAIVVCERTLPAAAAIASWTSALNTLANVGRFHRIPALLAFDNEEPAEWPAPVVACPSIAREATISRPHGLVVEEQPDSWSDLAGATGSARVVVSAREVPVTYEIDALREACESALGMERESAG